MFNALAYLPGRTLASTPLLSRYLPSTPAGITQTWLAQHCQPGDWVLDPFGISPHQVIEIAHAGYRVLTTVNNPIDRFLLELYAHPPKEEALRASLADLASSFKDRERLEPHIRSLYQTHCPECGAETEAHYFIWDKAANIPILKFISCHACSTTGEKPTSSLDINKAKQFTTTSPYIFRALERVAPLYDPDRPYVQEALQTYTPRAVYALMTIINKLETFSAERQRLLGMLLLHVLDETNVLWTYPATRGRPKHFVIPTKFREKNVWFALEEAIEVCRILFPTQTAHHDLELTYWPALPSSHHGVCLFKGRIRDLAMQLKSQQALPFDITTVTTTLPRPNLVYWTLSALWSGWLWGREASVQMKRVIRRRRFGKSLYAMAVYSALKYAGMLCAQRIPYYCLMPETDIGYIHATLTSACKTGLEIRGVAFHPHRKVALFHFAQGRKRSASTSTEEVREKDVHDILRSGIKQFLREIGEPAYYTQIHLAGLLALLNSPQGAQSLDDHPSKAWYQSNMLIKNVLLESLGKELISQKERQLLTSLWWLSQPISTQLPLADRVERKIFSLLQENEKIDFPTLDSQLCNTFRGLFTPSQEIILQCLESYAQVDPEFPNLWSLNPANRAENRKKDEDELVHLITLLGHQLGLEVSRTEFPPLEEIHPILWRQPEKNEVLFAFFLTTSAALFAMITAWEHFIKTNSSLKVSPHLIKVIVVPGSRAQLILFKISQNFILQSHLQKGWKFLKFRKLRSLVADTQLTLQNFIEALDLDPLSNIDPQLQLL